MEQETARILHTLTERAIGDRNAVALKDVLAARIPEGIKTFLQADIVDELTREISQGRKFSRVDISAPGMPGVLKGFIRTAALEYVFPRAELVASLSHATHFLGNYVCRPQWTLREFLFEDSASLPQKLFIERLQYTSDYSYLKTTLHATVLKKGWLDINKEQFTRLIRRIDHLMLQQLGARELAELTGPIFEFFSLSGLHSDGSVPLKPLLVFFNEKGQDLLTEHIERVCGEKGRETLTPRDLVVILEELEQAVQVNDEPLVQEAALLPEPVADPKVQVNMPQQSTDEAPQEESGRNEATSRVAMPRSSATAMQMNAALALTYAGATGKSTALPSLASLISREQRDAFVKSIFGKDEAYFNGVIETLERTSTWREASLYLNTFYEENRLDPFADEVVQFTDLVQQRYSTDHNR